MPFFFLSSLVLTCSQGENLPKLSEFTWWPCPAAWGLLEGSHLPPGHLQLLWKLNLGSQLDFVGWLLSEVCPMVAVAISGAFHGTVSAAPLLWGILGGFVSLLASCHGGDDALHPVPCPPRRVVLPQGPARCWTAKSAGCGRVCGQGLCLVRAFSFPWSVNVTGVTFSSEGVLFPQHSFTAG